MKVRGIMSSPVETISPKAMITEAAEKMKSCDVGVLPVEKGNKVVGMITDRDIVVRVIAKKLDPQKHKGRTSNDRGAICCFEDDDIEAAAKMMEDKQIHRVLVLGSDDTPVGILSLGDLANRIRGERLACEVLERICEPAPKGPAHTGS